MNTTFFDDRHPITVRIQHAAEQVRLANHAIDGESPLEVADLYGLLGELTDLLGRLPQLLHHIRDVIGDADAALYKHDHPGQSSEEELNLADFCVIEAFGSLALVHGALSQAWTNIGHLRSRETDCELLPCGCPTREVRDLGHQTGCDDDE